MGAKQVSLKPLRTEFRDLSLDDFFKNLPDWYVKKATGGEIQSSIDLLQKRI